MLHNSCRSDAGVIGNGVIFNSISKQCPLLDSINFNIETRKLTSTYKDFGVLGLDGFSNILDLKTDGTWNTVSDDEYFSFMTRNPNVVVMDLNMDQNHSRNNIFLTNCRKLEVLRLHCSTYKGKNLK